MREQEKEKTIEKERDHQENKGKGSLYICGTPIGNLEDITLRSLRILQEVHIIAAEDTRRTQKLLNYYDIKKRTTSYHQHNEKEKTEYLLSQLEEGHSVALVSNAGMPIISDPGMVLVREALLQGIQLIPVPGPTAFTTALVISGLSAQSFLFAGFLPQKVKERRSLLSSLSYQERTLIFYVAPHHIESALSDIESIFEERRLVVVREATKIYEERLEGTAKALLALFQERPPKGELTLLIEGASLRDRCIEDEDLSLKEHLSIYLERGMSKKEAVKRVAKERDLPKRQVYREALSFVVDPITGKVR